MAYDPRSPGNPWLPYPAGEPPYARGQGTELEGLPGVGFIPQSTATQTDTQPSSSFVDKAKQVTQKTPVNTRSYPEPPFWVTEITYDDGSKEWKKEDLEQAIKAGATDTWRVKEEKEVADAAAAEAAKATEEAAIAKAKAERLAAEQQAEKERLEREANENKPENRPAIVPIPQSQSLDPNKPGGVATGPISNAVEGQYFGDKEKYGLKLGKGGVAPGGGNPNEMYRWFKEAMIAGYPNAMDLWMKNPEQAIGAYNQWKIREQAAGRAFVGVKDDGTVGGGRLIPTDRLPDFQTDAAEERASAQQAATQQAATPGVGSGILGAIREGGNTFSGIEQGRDTDFSVWEELQRTGMTGSPFEAAAESYLKSQIPQFSAQGAMQSVRDQTPLGISDFLQQSYGGASMSPEDLRMMISGQPGTGVNPTAFANVLDALDQKREAGTAFNLALAGSPLANAPMAIRNPLASQGEDYWNEYEQKLLGGEIEDVKGQADFLRFAAGKMGIV